MENKQQQNFDLTSTTSVTISMPNAESVASKVSKTKNQLVKEMESNANQIKHLKAAAENYKFLLAEKEKTIGDLNVGIQLVKQSFLPLDDKIQATQNQVREKRAGELDLLRQKVKEAAEWEKNFNGYISEYKFKIDGTNARLLTHRQNGAAECAALERRYHNEVENVNASLKELDKVYKQVLAEHAKLSDEKNFQLEKMDVLKKEFNQMRTQLEEIAAERTTFSKQTKDLDARILQLGEQSKQERESPTLLKIEDNKRNLALRSKQISDAKSLRQQKIQSLGAQTIKLKAIEQERDILVVVRKSLEKSFQEKTQELEECAAEIASKEAHLESTRERTEEFERQMLEMLDEVRRKSECYGAELMRQMEGRRRESIHFVAQQDARKRAEKKERERTKEELRQEMQAMEQMMEVLSMAHRLEMDGKQRHYERLERDLQVFGECEKQGNEYEISLIKSNIEKLGVKRQTGKTDFDQQQAQIKQEVEWLRRKMDSVKHAADASKVIADNLQRAEVTRKLVRDLERKISAKKAKYFELHKDAFELKNDLAEKGVASEIEPDETAASSIIQSSSEQLGVPKLDGPVTKLLMQRGNGQVVEQVSIEGANGNFTTQTLSKVVTDSDPANYVVETHQMQMNMPGFDSNSNCTTKFRKVVYSGKGIDMNVLNEAKRISAIHPNGVTQEAAETDEEFKLRKVLVKRAADLQKLMESAEFAQNPKEKKVEEQMARAQSVFSQITQLVAQSQHDLTQSLTHLEADFHQDSFTKNANVRNHGMAKK